MEKQKPDNSIHAGHRQRVKLNVMQNGFSQLEDHKLLELMLFYAVPRGDTNEIAHRLIKEFGSLGGVLKANVSQLKKIDGVGENTAIMIAASNEMFLRAQRERTIKRTAYKTTAEVAELAASLFVGESVEKVIVLCFDSARRFKKWSVISSGNSDSVDIDVRKIVEAAMESSASLVALAHNHPFSPANPSANDIDATRTVTVVLRKLGVLLSDHIIVGMDGETYSMYSDEKFMKLFY